MNISKTEIRLGKVKGAVKGASDETESLRIVQGLSFQKYSRLWYIDFEGTIFCSVKNCIIR